MSVVVNEQGQILRTSDGSLLESGGPFLKTLGGHNAIAKPSVPFALWNLNGLQLLDGRTVSFTELYRKQAWIATAVNKLTRQISRLPLKVYRKNSQGERERVTDGRLVELIRNPAPRCGPIQLKQWLALSTLIHGNATLLKARQERFGPPTRLWPLDWRLMLPHVENSRIEFWRTAEFGKAVLLDPADVVHLAWEAPDGRVGVSPLEQLGITIRVETSAQDYQESYLRQGARPPSAITLPDGVVLDDAIRAEMRADLEETYAGAANAGRPALLPGGTTWDSIAHTAHEAELIDQRRITREEIAAVYDVPPPMIGILDRATFSNVTEQHRMLFTTVLGPWLSLIEESFQSQIISPEPAFAGLFVEFDLAEVLKGDKLKEISALKMAVQAGLLTINEAREIQNRSKFEAEWCNQPLIPSNNLSSSPDARDPESPERVARSFGYESPAELVAALRANGNGAAVPHS